MAADHCSSQYLSTVHDVDGCDGHDVHDARHVDGDVEKIWVAHFVCLRRLYGPNAHSTLSMRFVASVPYRAHRFPAYLQRTLTTLK